MEADMSKSKPMPITEFMALFPDDDACLEHLFKARFGADHECSRCGESGKWKKLAKMPAYTCQCGNHVHPMVGTPFHKSHTPLQKWFYAMYLFTTTRHGVPAKELQRQLSVNYKTAWRMGHEIRKYLALVDGDPPLDGHVEIDEAFIGGKRKGKGRGQGSYAKNKDIVLGMVQRGGDVITRVIPNTQGTSIIPTVIQKVNPLATISTDEAPVYAKLKALGYRHDAVSHRQNEYVRGPVHTNMIEAFWSILKRSIKGTHVHVSTQHLPKYLGEFEFRWNLRHDPAAMFPLLLKRLAT
jgi:transposase-like protein